MTDLWGRRARRPCATRASAIPNRPEGRVGQDGIPGWHPAWALVIHVVSRLIKPAGCHPAPLTPSSMDFSKLHILPELANAFQQSVSPAVSAAGLNACCVRDINRSVNGS